ncbi:hypothetical protein [Mucilaginibacter terrenus]|nr:hypothetical protein [Mucilaginibacter terrenus]
MKTAKIILLGILATVVVSSCGIFKKDCGCPHFGARKPTQKVYRS